MTLFELDKKQTELKARLEGILEDSEGEVTPEADDFMDQMLENEYAVSAKFDKYGFVMAAIEAEEEMLQQRIMALQNRLSVKRNARERLKARLHRFMENNSIKKVEGEYFVFKVQKNGGRFPVSYQEGLRPEDVDERFRRVRVDLDTSAIYQALKEGEKLEFAEFGERGTHLRIA